MIAYFLPLTEEELGGIAYWRGRCCWADAAAFNVRLPEDCDGWAGSYDADETPHGTGLYFDTEAEAREYRDECQKDAAGGHSMFSGITFAKKMRDFLDTIN